MNDNTSVDYEEIKAEALRDPEVRQAYEDLEPAYQLALLRIKRGWTQTELAEKIGTTQSSIARMETGNCGEVLMQRMAAALGARIVIVPADEAGARPS